MNFEISNEIPADIQALADARVQARADKEWARSDELRDQLKELGWIIEDSRQGQKIKKG